MATLPDFHERGEARAERWILPDGKVRCAGCGGAFDAMDVQASSVDPYSAPVCEQCMSEMETAPEAETKNG